jgi:hypothetical protein
MMAPAEYDRSQIEQLDKETLITIILKLPQQVRQLQQIVDEQMS